ncbi:MAG TPA: hypothetical protein VNF99_10115 [Stellaceae bacterium]|nr:hypothetical protein [Stellaceae bacterium]
MADPRREHGAQSGAGDGPAAVRLRFGRPPRAANDNAFSWLRQLPQRLPLLVALALLAWALANAFSGR